MGGEVIVAAYTYDPDRTFTYLGDDARPYPGYVQVFPPEGETEEETLTTPLIGRPGRAACHIGWTTTHDGQGNPEPPGEIPPPDGNWAQDLGEGA